MELKKCARCGKFYASNVDVCSECEKKDNAELNKLKGFFEEQYLTGTTKSQISISTGISARNLNRYLSYEEFSGIYIPETAEGVGINGIGTEGNVGL